MKRAALAVLTLTLAVLPGATAGDESEPLDRKIARMLLVGTRGSEVKSGGDFERFVCDLGVGGILLFDKTAGSRSGKRNILSRFQLQMLTENLQTLAERCGDAPLLIAADVEGGKVNRLSGLEGLEDIKSAAWLGEHPPIRTHDEASRIAAALSESGVNWNLAPVVDVAINPDNPIIAKLGRSFSNEPSVVTEHAKAFVRAHRKYGVLTCLKHFPGHGSSRADSHKGAVDITDTAEPDVELQPYREMLYSGLVDCVMPGHLFNRNIDANNMVTLSTASIAILREEMGFNGIVLSDDLQMGAIRKSLPIGEAAVQAVLAGVDMITLSYSRARKRRGAARTVHRALMAAVEDGRIPQSRIEEANQRILYFKSQIP
ncbi:MAG: glycoside hydrolase family 3 [Elusimicrobia bacterium]|nr:MAG: glycoside hydrolase family 3 [Elusimicrobiota bacterium]